MTRRIKELPLNGRPVPDTVDIDLLGTELKVGSTINEAIVCVCVCVCVCVRADARARVCTCMCVVYVYMVRACDCAFERV